MVGTFIADARIKRCGIGVAFIWSGVPFYNYYLSRKHSDKVGRFDRLLSFWSSLILCFAFALFLILRPMLAESMGFVGAQNIS